MKVRRRHRDRSGTVLVFTIIMMVVLFGLVALAVDLGYLNVIRSQLQSTADATALAAVGRLIDEGILIGNGDPLYAIQHARATANQYAYFNPVAGTPSGLAQEDVQIGYLRLSDPSLNMGFADPSLFNAARVRVRRTAEQNGAVPLFFARVLGINTSEQQAEATAVFLRTNLIGFRIPPSGENLPILPFALDKQTWDNLLAGDGPDNWSYDAEWDEVCAGSDGILEANLYPEGVDAPGNRGTVDIGSNNNSTADIAGQVLEGISAEDLEFHGGKLELGEDGTLTLNGDTGISAGVKDELALKAGDTGIVPIFTEVTGPGNNAVYTVVHFAGVRIMHANLTGNMPDKHVVIQPATVRLPDGSGIFAPASDQATSSFIPSPVWLIR